MDLGAPITSPDPARRNSGWFLDDLRPTLTLSSPRAGTSTQALNTIRLGAFDYYSGLDRSSLSVKANFAINGKPAGTELAPYFFETADHIWSMTVAPALTDLPSGVLTVSVRDNQGNITRIERTFKVQSTTSTPGEPPAISAVYPSSGPSVGGTRIQVLGRNFQPGAVVRLGGVPLSAVRSQECC